MSQSSTPSREILKLQRRYPRLIALKQSLSHDLDLLGLYPMVSLTYPLVAASVSQSALFTHTALTIVQVNGVLQPLSGALAAVDIPTPQPQGLTLIPGDDPLHQFQAPGPTDVRGICPTLNTLANHGYISRNGVKYCFPIFVISAYCFLDFKLCRSCQCHTDRLWIRLRPFCVSLCFRPHGWRRLDHW